MAENQGNPNHDELGRFTTKEHNYVGTSVENKLAKLGFSPDKFEKPKLNDDFYRVSFKDGYKIQGQEARLGKGRIQYLIDEYGVWDENSNYAKAYIGFINPEDFINSTISDMDEITKKELDNSGELDLERLNNNIQTPFLIVDFDNGEIVGHEGRHRMAAFIKSGIKRVPIVFRDASLNFNKNNAKPKRLENITIKGQVFDESDYNRKGQDISLNTDLIPLNYKNIETIYKIFG